MDLMKALTSQYMKKELPEMNVGDTVRVHVKIKEGSRERIQVFEGTIIAKKHGGIEESITVRRISYGVGCEKVFPVHAPNVVDVETVRHGKVRRAKLYYLRDRLGGKRGFPPKRLHLDCTLVKANSISFTPPQAAEFIHSVASPLQVKTIGFDLV